MLLAAGCATSISRRIAWPSLVRTMPPMGSSSIFNIALGPRHDLMMSATVFAAVMLESCALRPNCRSPPGVCVSAVVSVGCGYSQAKTEHTHDDYWRLHFEDSGRKNTTQRKQGCEVTKWGVSCVWCLTALPSYQKHLNRDATTAFSAPASSHAHNSPATADYYLGITCS
jgi:hypothetical protein